MGALATLSAPPLPVDPGEQVECHVTVRNEGSVVDAFTVEPLGQPESWATVDPAELPLLPGEEGVVTVRFTPPRTPATPSGSVSFALRVVSREDPTGNAVEEGLLEVGSFTEVGAELLPRTSRARGRRTGKHEVAIDNRGNAPAQVTLQPLDPDEKVEVSLPTPVVEVGPGRCQIVPVAVRGRKRFWQGSAVTLPFQVHVEPPGTAPLTLEGSLLQEAVLPKWLLRAAIAGLALVAMLVGLWLTVLRPTIEDSARNAATAEAAKVAKKEAAAAVAEQQGKIDDLAGQVDAAAARGGAAKAPAAPPKTSTVDPLGDPIAVRLAAGAGNQKPSVVLSKTMLVSITDLLMQNPAGDAGLVTVTSDGKALYTARLENFRDLDLHFVAPFAFKPGAKLGISVSCQNPGPAVKPCTPAITVSGFARKPA